MIRLKVENLSKQYRLGEIGTGTISQDLNRFWAKLRGKEDPTALVGVENDRTKSGNDEFVLALKDINFEVKQGEILGVIGRNGAGKSTLLKILSKVTGPTTGEIKINGRIGALLEVGTGMHPELTGVENIYLNGAILGMTKKEIKNKIDEIIEFAGIAKYKDTPFKRYSSGMRVRLGFAVAAFLEPEILIVDEVLAVGDAEFQKRAIGKMKEVSQGEGRTVLFVSHNMASIRQLCGKTIFMENGKINAIGPTDEMINKYLTQNTESNTSVCFTKDVGMNESGFKNVEFLNKINNVFDFNDEIVLLANFYAAIDVDLIVAIYLRNSVGEVVFFSESLDNQKVYTTKDSCVKISIPSKQLLQGNYYITIGLRETNGKVIETLKDVLIVQIEDTYNKRPNRPGSVFLNVKWN